MRLIDADRLRKELDVDKYGQISTSITKLNIAIERSKVDAVEVVRCIECKWYDPPHILYKDGTRKNVGKDELTVTADVGINCGGKCMAHSKTYCTNHDREDPEDEPNIVIFRNPMDFCSYGERKE